MSRICAMASAVGWLVRATSSANHDRSRSAPEIRSRLTMAHYMQMHVRERERGRGRMRESSLFFLVARGSFRLRLLAQSLSNMQDDLLLTPIFAEIARRRK